jgi:hypothetical protein
MKLDALSEDTIESAASRNACRVALTEDIRYSVNNREVYKVATIVLDAVINKIPEISCTIYSANEEKCEVAVRYGEYYNELLKKRSWKFAMKLRVLLSKRHVYIVGTNIRFPFSDEMPDQVAGIIYKYLMLS